MPAAQIDRLNREIGAAIQQIANPAVFSVEINALLAKYADLSYRAGHAIRGAKLVPSYHITPLVVRQVELKLVEACRLFPVTSLEAADALWHSEYLEPRRLAALMLGQISPTPPEPILDRIISWTLPPVDPDLLALVFELGALRIRRECPDHLLSLLEKWINLVDPISRGTALKAIPPIVKDPQFENIPPIFRMISPLMQTAPSALQDDLQFAIKALSERSPAETGYFLRQILSLATSPASIRLVRRCLPYFGKEQQTSLRAALAARTK